MKPDASRLALALPDKSTAARSAFLAGGGEMIFPLPEIEIVGLIMDLPQHEYEAIRRAIPIACVDLVIINANREVLLVRRVNEPARGEWWFPGGRVHLNQTRENAAKRILLKECGLRAVRLDESSPPWMSSSRENPSVRSVTGSRRCMPLMSAHPSMLPSILRRKHSPGETSSCGENNPCTRWS